MSGIVGILNLDGAPVDRALLRDLSASLTYRGPDARAVWTDGPVGFGHTLLRTTEQDDRVQQPFTLNGATWIILDGRIDARHELSASLAAGGAGHGDLDLTTTSDVELMLRAYLTWGEACVHHVLGDFAFAIWDGPQRRLFCGRDPLGIKLFYYAVIGRSVVFSNTLACLRRHPRVSSRLNELALADFLLFRQNCDLHTSAFSDIQRLPGGHTLAVHDSVVMVRAYWMPSPRETVRYGHAQEYLERYEQVMGRAVADRLRTPKVNLLLSGGLDSAAIALHIRDAAATQGHPIEARALTLSFGSLSSAEEHRYAALTAGALGLPLEYLAFGQEALHDWDHPDLQTPEPNLYMLPLRAHSFHKLLNAHSPVTLFGHGSDLLFSSSSVTIADLFGSLPAPAAVTTLWQSARVFHRVPRPGSGLMRRLRPHFAGAAPLHAYPNWINKEFEARLHLRERWAAILSNAYPSAHTATSGTYDPFRTPYEVALHEWYDPSTSGLPWEVWYPWLDLRVLDFVLGLPSVPWCLNKGIVRAALRDRLPKEIVDRPKTSGAVNPFAALASKTSRLLEDPRRIPELEAYVDLDRVLAHPEALLPTPGYRPFPVGLSVLSFGRWLQAVTSSQPSAL